MGSTSGPKEQSVDNMPLGTKYELQEQKPHSEIDLASNSKNETEQSTPLKIVKRSFIFGEVLIRKDKTNTSVIGEENSESSEDFCEDSSEESEFHEDTNVNITLAKNLQKNKKVSNEEFKTDIGGDVKTEKELNSIENESMNELVEFKNYDFNSDHVMQGAENEFLEHNKEDFDTDLLNNIKIEHQIFSTNGNDHTSEFMEYQNEDFNFDGLQGKEDAVERKQYDRQENKINVIEVVVNGEMILQCGEPGCVYRNKFRSHIKRHSIIHKQSEEIREMYKDRLVQCPYAGCDYEHIYWSSVERHANSRHKTDDQVSWHYCDQEGCTFKTKYRGSLGEHRKIHKKEIGEKLKTFKCEICDMETIRKSTLKRHMLIHKNDSEVRMEQCKFCEFKSRHRSSILKHYQLIHKLGNSTSPEEAQKILKCPHCNFQSKHPSAIDKHMVVHKSPDEVEMYKCDSCPYQTIHKRSLKSHTAKHLPPDQELQCTLCSFRTKYKTSLRKHVIVYHKKEEETTTYACEFCSYKTKLKQYIKKHLAKTHKEAMAALETGKIKEESSSLTLE